MFLLRILEVSTNEFGFKYELRKLAKNKLNSVFTLFYWLLKVISEPYNFI